MQKRKKTKKRPKESQNSVVFKFVKRTLGLSSAEIAQRLQVTRSKVHAWSRNMYSVKKTDKGKPRRLYRCIDAFHFKAFMASLSDDEIKAIRQSGR
jgi:DNA-binding transcriptional regulator YiaG